MTLGENIADNAGLKYAYLVCIAVFSKNISEDISMERDLEMEWIENLVNWKDSRYETSVKVLCASLLWIG